MPRRNNALQLQPQSRPGSPPRWLPPPPRGESFNSGLGSLVARLVRRFATASVGAWSGGLSSGFCGVLSGLASEVPVLNRLVSGDDFTTWCQPVTDRLIFYVTGSAVNLVSNWATGYDIVQMPAFNSGKRALLTTEFTTNDPIRWRAVGSSTGYSQGGIIQTLMMSISYWDVTAGNYISTVCACDSVFKDEIYNDTAGTYARNHLEVVPIDWVNHTVLNGISPVDSLYEVNATHPLRIRFYLSYSVTSANTTTLADVLPLNTFMTQSSTYSAPQNILGMITELKMIPQDVGANEVGDISGYFPSNDPATALVYHCGGGHDPATDAFITTVTDYV